MIETVKAYLGVFLATVFGVLLAFQTVRLDMSQAELGQTVKALEQQKTLAASAWALSITAARKTELELGVSAAATRKETNDQVQTLSRERDALLKRVRIAEAKAATAAVVSKATAAACPGPVAGVSDTAELLGTLGSEDVEEANRADTIRVHLLACYAQYDAARQALSQ